MAYQVAADNFIPGGNNRVILATDGDFTATGLAHNVENGLTRTAFIDGTPPGFIGDVFEMEVGELRGPIAAGKGYLDSVPIEDVAGWEKDFHEFMAEKHSGVLHAIAESGKLEDSTVEHLTAAIEEFRASRG